MIGIVRRAPRAPSLHVEPGGDGARMPVKRGWVGLRGDVRSEFARLGALPCDGVKTARTEERRIK